MPQADRLVRRHAKHTPSGSLEESCFCTLLDHILHEARIYLSSGAGLSSKFHPEEISRRKEEDLLEKESHRLVRRECLGGCSVTVTHMDVPVGIPSSAALEQRGRTESAPGAREASEQQKDLPAGLTCQPRGYSLAGAAEIRSLYPVWER